MIFRARLSTNAILATIIYYIIIIVVLVTTVKELGKKEILIFFVIIIALLPFLMRVRYYRVEKDVLIIHNQGWKKTILLNSVTSIKRVDYKDLGLTLRLFGSGGVWGYFGYFWSKQPGIINFQVTDMSDLILISLKNNKKFLVSPINSDDFLNFSIPLIKGLTG